MRYCETPLANKMQLESIINNNYCQPTKRKNPPTKYNWFCADDFIIFGKQDEMVDGVKEMDQHGIY